MLCFGKIPHPLKMQKASSTDIPQTYGISPSPAKFCKNSAAQDRARFRRYSYVRMDVSCVKIIDRGVNKSEPELDMQLRNAGIKTLMPASAARRLRQRHDK